MMKLILTSVLLVTTSAFAAETKIAVVDIPKAIQATREGKQVKTKLEEEFNKRKSDMEKRAKDIQKMQADFEKKSLVLSDEVRKSKEKEIETEKMKYMELRDKNMQDLNKKDRELSEPLRKKLFAAIEKISKEEKYTAIFHKNEQILVWTSSEIDITDRLIKELEK
jgi:outer membrane protein